MLEYVVYPFNVSLTYTMCHCPNLGSVMMLVHPDVRGQVAHHLQGTWALEGDNGFGAIKVLSFQTPCTLQWWLSTLFTPITWQKQTAFACTICQETCDRPKWYSDGACVMDTVSSPNCIIIPIIISSIETQLILLWENGLSNLQWQTNKDDNFDISGTTKFFGNLTSDSNSECQKMSENMSFIIFPQVVKVVNNFGQNPQTFWVI